MSRVRRQLPPWPPLVVAATLLAVELPALADETPAPQPQRLVYVPPDLGAPPTRTLAAVRGAGDHAGPQVLAPEQTGLTAREQPVLFWYQGAPSAARVTVTVIDEEAVDPLLEADLGEITEPGIHALDLAAQDVRLEPGVEYQWSVAEVVDPEQRSADLVTSGTIRREDGAGGASLEALVGAGYWYDALALLAGEIAARPGDPEPRRRRAELLDQVGLAEAAAHERALADAQ
jgi:hypothetical protein